MNLFCSSTWCNKMINTGHLIQNKLPQKCSIISPGKCISFVKAKYKLRFPAERDNLWEMIWRVISGPSARMRWGSTWAKKGPSNWHPSNKCVTRVCNKQWRKQKTPFSSLCLSLLFLCAHRRWRRQFTRRNLVARTSGAAGSSPFPLSGTDVCWSGNDAILTLGFCVSADEIFRFQAFNNACVGKWRKMGATMKFGDFLCMRHVRKWRASACFEIVAAEWKNMDEPRVCDQMEIDVRLCGIWYWKYKLNLTLRQLAFKIEALVKLTLSCARLLQFISAGKKFIAAIECAIFIYNSVLLRNYWILTVDFLYIFEGKNSLKNHPGKFRKKSNVPSSMSPTKGAKRRHY